MNAFPDLSYEPWVPTRETLHRWLQIVGKLRLATSSRRNHWWNVPFHLTGTGITTRPMGQDPSFAVDFDFVDHRVIAASIDGRRASFSLPGNSVGSFHARLLETLAAIGVDGACVADAHPFDLPDASRPFSADTEHASYDPAAVTRYWQALSTINLVLEQFSGRFSGKVSPVHHFWHTFDIAATRFSDTVVPHNRTVDSVTREAYSREVISFGFWFGDPTFAEPAFYSYTAPEPHGLADEPLPAAAEWLDRGSSHLAILRYSDVTDAPQPREAILNFYQQAYEAGARLAGWDIARLACIDGATDPFRQLAAPDTIM